MRPSSASLSTIDSASVSIGEAAGRENTLFQLGPVCVTKPPCRIGTSPQYINDDFPLPEKPMTDTNRFAASLTRISSACPSRPKKRWHSSMVNGLSPGNGLAPRGAQATGLSETGVSISPTWTGCFSIAGVSNVKINQTGGNLIKPD